MFAYLRSLASRFTGSELGRNTLWMLGGQFLRTAVQALYFVILARALDPDGYGGFVSGLAIVMIAAPFASIGSGFILIKNVARDPSTFPTQWGNALFVIGTSGLALIGVVVAVAAVVLPRTIPIVMVAVLGASELVAARVVETAAHAFIAFRKLKLTSALHLTLSLTRLAAIALLTTIVHEPSLLTWAISYLVATTVAAALALVLVRAQLGRASFRIDARSLELGEGFWFSVSSSAQTLYNDVDKSLLSRISGLAPAGIYAAAYRVLDVAFSPISAAISAAYSRFFQEGAKGLSGALAVSRRLIPWACLYALVGALGLVLCAGLVPRVLGPSYADTAEAIRWLSPILVLRAVHYFLADALSGAGFQRVRCAVQLGVATVNVGLNLALLPAYSWRGAAIASVASDALLCAGLAIVVAYYSRATPPAATSS